MSDSTRRVSEMVREVVETDGVVRHGLAKGIINIRALARNIQTSSGDKVSFEAVVSAIRRYPIRRSLESRPILAKMITKLSMKNKMVAVVLRNQLEIPIDLAKFSSEVDYARGDTLRIVSGPEVATLVFDSKNLEKLTAMISKRNILTITRNLAELIVQHSEAIVRKPGNVAAITTQLAINDVNMLDCVATYGPPPQVMIILDEKDALKAYEAMERLSRGET